MKERAKLREALILKAKAEEQVQIQGVKRISDIRQICESFDIMKKPSNYQLFSK